MRAFECKQDHRGKNGQGGHSGKNGKPGPEGTARRGGGSGGETARSFLPIAAMLTSLVLADACGRDSSVGSLQAALTGSTTVTLQDGVDGYGGTTDTQIAQNAPTTNYGAVATINADGDEPSRSGKDVAALFRWTLAAIPVGSTIQSAAMVFQVTNASANTYPVFPVLRAWTEGAATWQRAAPGVSWQTPGALGDADRDRVSVAALAAPAVGAYTAVLNAAGVAMIGQWVNDPTRNNGVIIAHAANSDGVDLASRESAGTASLSNRPRLVITFVPPAASASGVSATGGAAGAGTGGASAAVDAAADVPVDGVADVPQATGAAGTGGAAPGGAATGGAGTDGAATGGAATGGAGTGGAPDAVLYAVGDIADCDSEGDTATAALLDGSTDPVALLGDIVYPDGSAADFANCFEPTWGRHRARLRPAPGNHEYLTPDAAGYFAYFGAAAGDPTRGYYSYDVGAWHVIALNSGLCTDSPSACVDQAQVDWLRADLAAHPSRCTLAYWHHPRFSSGHNGNASGTAALWQTLLDGGADVVLGGHDHGYQRLGPLNASGAMTSASTGMIEIVAGTGGADLNNSFAGTKPANVVIRNGAAWGVLKMTLRERGYHWQFLPAAGSTFTDSGDADCR